MLSSTITLKLKIIMPSEGNQASFPPKTYILSNLYKMPQNANYSIVIEGRSVVSGG